MRHVALLWVATMVVVTGCSGPSDARPPAPRPAVANQAAVPTASQAPGPSATPAATPRPTRPSGGVSRAQRLSRPGDHALPAGTLTMSYNVLTASSSPLEQRLRKARRSLARSSGIALYLAGGTRLNAADLRAIQNLGRPAAAGGLDLPALSRLYIYNLRSLPGGKECTADSGLACAGQRSYGGLQPLLWHNGWWDSWVADLHLDDLRTIRAGAFSNTNFASISFRSARSVGTMAFGHGPRSRLTHVYLPNATTIGTDAFRRNQNLVRVSLPRVTKVDDYAFDDADRLEVFSAPKMVTIGRNALNDAHSLRTVNFASVKYIGINCFDGNGDAKAGTGIRTLRLPALEELDDNAIVGLNSLTYIYAPVLKVAAPGAMSRNPSLVKVYAPKLTSVAPNTFENDPELKELIIPGR